MTKVKHEERVIEHLWAYIYHMHCYNRQYHVLALYDLHVNKHGTSWEKLQTLNTSTCSYAPT